MKKNDLFSKRNATYVSSLAGSFLTVFYKEELDYYFDQIPKTIVTIGLVLLVIYITIKLFFLKKKDSHVLYIPSENDYVHKDTGLGSTVILIIAFLTYGYFINEYNIHGILIFLFLLILSVSSIPLEKTTSFQVKNKNITYKNGKEERVFKTDEIISLEVYPNQIHIHKQDSKETLLFLSLDQIDFQNIKSYFNKRVPEISVKLAQNSSN
ncbi:hypothetical protein BTO06_00780 [Tenacibaculum sp. SZ-18]|uniref:hypothetical protein n=1 Tax=Tenacibaculum sp. SZ-18 TaxID=754423 RepID=UPI000C2D17A8|nr:hypothetical protein [Tenacibaculum sp. SZ-18]AUC13769.1 hypothetical protein BTO06_00780 [Tenacibaculum sp. SZ-18]